MSGARPGLDRRRVAGVVLAAGTSRRFGSSPPKQLWEVEGEPLVRRVCRRALVSHLDRVLVVVGHQARRVAQALEDLPVLIAENPTYRKGQSSSVGAGVAALTDTGEDFDGAVFLPVDQPFLDRGHIDRMVASFDRLGEAARSAILVPSHGVRRGAPVLFGADHFPALLRLEGDEGGRQLLRIRSDRLIPVELRSELPLLDADTPEELERLLTEAETSRS